MTAIADNNITDVADGGDIRYDPYDAELNTDPHPTFSAFARTRRCTTTPCTYAQARLVDVMLQRPTTRPSVPPEGPCRIVGYGMDIFPGTRNAVTMITDAELSMASVIRG